MTTLTNSILEAVREGAGFPEAFTPLHEPEFAGREEDYVADCIRTGWVSSVGSFVDRFEADLAEFTGCSRAVATVNGTAALHIALKCSGVQAGDEVLLPTLTFVATANATSYAGAIPHFVDSEATTLAVCPEALRSHLEECAEKRDGGCFNRKTGRRIAALVVMHAFGHPAQLDPLLELCREWSIPLVEDAAESLGSYYQGRHTGGFGLVSALSFNGNKILTTGGGGAILTNDPAIADRAKHLTTTARISDGWNFTHDEIGYNYRLPNLNAALGCAQLERITDMLQRKRALAMRYKALFKDIAGVRLLEEPQGTESNYWLCTLVLEQFDHQLHTEVLSALNDAGLMARPVWTLMHRLPMFADAPRADLSCAERLAVQIINIPSSPKLFAAPAGAGGDV
ncbi:LegC family aminotransferase [Parerythrobacter jejuensis]|uniref:GDP-perosamine synthase n=1 Tax=Parerythrobacter jejuensis TaxID=795812 RepID=A0A845AKU6_9SPHN|nr:LegC family aminotransferase [Parerythrobacter jejuensis]MXP30890.1 LegC family aminotransferase [Parerythrobacter jejuensis]MXP33650.1 LegC family aminotransferase [Parerythrobacter jejuensis]